ncbi:MAG: hypothetical protein SFZ03_01110 [Candidatus Melainabacteria bacterium]|nr:hypothetical protein [Candidatus Melainabacteria bacterium]
MQFEQPENLNSMVALTAEAYEQELEAIEQTALSALENTDGRQSVPPTGQEHLPSRRLIAWWENIPSWLELAYYHPGKRPGADGAREASLVEAYVHGSGFWFIACNQLPRGGDGDAL